MSAILFVTCDAGGNVPPAIALAAELRARRHDVRVMGHRAQAGRVDLAGLEFLGFTGARDFRGADSNSPLAWVAMIGDREMGRDVARELDARPADLVVVDCMAFGAIEVVAGRGVPYVLLEHTFHAYWTDSWLPGPMGIGLRLKRFPTKRLVEGARARLVVALRELDPAAAPARNVVHVGPVAEGTPARPTEPTVLVSLSTLNFPGMKDALQKIIDVLGTLPVRGIVTSGPAIDPHALRAPSNVEVLGFVQHAEIMPSASMMIGHGGHATTMTALAHDLPLVVLPMHPMLDQKMVGRAVERAGAGRLLTKKAKPDAIASVVSELMTDGAHRAAAARLGAEIRRASGAVRGADVLEGLTTEGAAVSQ